MAIDYTNSKAALGAVEPFNAHDTSGFERLEPLLSPELLRQRFLFGVPLVSFAKDPVTGKRAVMTDDILKDYINGAVVDAEVQSSTTIMPVQYREILPYDRAEYLSFGYMKAHHRPIYSLDEFHITTADETRVFDVPLLWVSTANLQYGQINLIPLGLALTGSPYGGGSVISGVSSGAAAMLALLANATWISSWWEVLYSAGFKDGMVPRYVNDLIGCIAAIRILSELAATIRAQSSSLGVDGLSQSVSTPGPQIYEIRISKLEEQKKKGLKVMKRKSGLNIFSGNV